MKEFSYKEVETATKGFAPEMLIGRGSHGLVYRGVMDSDKLVVAVKRPSYSGEDVTAKLRNEMSILSSISSPHIVNLLGVVSTGRNETEGRDDKVSSMLLVMEFMPNGSLHDLIHSSAQAPPTWALRVVSALQVATALQALHEAKPPVVHRDVKSSNILMDSRWDAKVADFSLAVRDRPSPTTAPPAAPYPAGTIGYLDPCYTGPSKLGPENDVFSFGVVLLELVSGRRAMDSARDTTSIVAWASPLLRDAGGGGVAELRDSRMALASGTERRSVARVLRLAARCVSLDREKRPAAAEIVAELRMAVERLRRPVLTSHLRVSISKRIHGCVNAWRTKARVMATRIESTTDHLPEDEEEDGNLDSEKTDLCRWRMTRPSNRRQVITALIARHLRL